MQRKILMVDDEPQLLKLASRRLEKRGFEVHTAGDGRHGLKRIEELKPDLVLLDLLMPILNGFEVLEALRGSELTRNLPVIVVTANSQTADLEKAIQVGANDTVTKPFVAEDLLEKIDRLISGETTA